MSERGSFVTEYIYCEKCADAVESLLCSDPHEGLCAQRLTGWPMPGGAVEGPEQTWKLPIIAGKVGGLYDGEEAQVFEFELIPKIAAVICHPVTVVVLPDSCHARADVFRIVPKPSEPHV